MSEQIKPPVNVGDKIQVGTLLTTGEVFWGTVQIVTRVKLDGTPVYRPRWAKIDKTPDCWRIQK